MDTQQIPTSVSPATTYCSELEYLIGLQSEGCWGSQPRRSQRLLDKKQVTKALKEEDINMKITQASECRSPQLFDEMDGECSQLAQLTAVHAITTKVCKKRGRKLGTGKKPIRKPKVVHSEPMPFTSVHDVNPQHSVKSEPSILPMRSTFATNAIIPDPTPRKASFTGSAMITNSTQTHSYQCKNFTQTVLPERYPAHFIHQLPPEPEYITGTIVSSELRRESYGAAVQEALPLQPVVTKLAACHEEYSPLSLGAESVTSTTPSLSESLCEVFGTTKIRSLLNIELPREYRVQEFHLPVLASLLEVDLGRLRVLLELIQRLTLEQLQQLSQECCDVVSVNSSSEE